MTETRQFKLKYKANFYTTVKREEITVNNKTKAYSIIFDFHKRIYNDPINLLKGVKELALDYQDTKYSMEVIDDALVHFLLLKQRQEPLYEYIRKLKTARGVLESHVGDPLIPTKIIKASEDYDENDFTNYNELKQHVCEQFCATSF